MKLPSLLAAFIVTSIAYPVRAQDRTPSPTPSPNQEEEITKTVDFPSPDGKFAFLIGRSEYQQMIDLIHKKTEKVLQHITDDDMSSVYYTVLWAPDSKRFALMTRVGHPNQGVTVYFQNGETFREIELPDVRADIPEKLKRGRSFPHVSANNWQEAKEWKKSGSLLLTIDTTIDGAGYGVRAVRTVLVGFDQSGKPKILKSTIKYEASKDL